MTVLIAFIITLFQVLFWVAVVALGLVIVAGILAVPIACIIRMTR